MVDERLSPAKIKARDSGAKSSRAPLLNGGIFRIWKYVVIVRYLCFGAEIATIAASELGFSCVMSTITKSVGTIVNIEDN